MTTTASELSPASRLLALPEAERRSFLASLSEEDATALLFDWRGFNARPSQTAPTGQWDIWLILAGRGFGKTRAGAEFVREEIFTNNKRSIGVIAESQEELVNHILFGESGLLKTAAPGQIVAYNQKPFKIIYSNGAIVRGYNARSPDKLRGAQFDCVWSDELAKWQYASETWEQIQFCLRLSSQPRQVITTTPRPINLIKDIVAGREGKVVITRGNTADNTANLSPTFIAKIYARYGDTRLGRQELNGEILGDTPGALWTHPTLEAYRLPRASLPSLSFSRIIVAIDPAISHTENSDTHGIIVAGLLVTGDAVILEDGSMVGAPSDWARRAVALKHKYDADAFVIEVNQGGDMCEAVLRTVAPYDRVIKVRATKGKHIRAEPVAALYEQGRVRHLGSFPDLEEQLTLMTTEGYSGDGSPDRADALVWALTELFPSVINIEHKDVTRLTRPNVIV